MRKRNSFHLPSVLAIIAALLLTMADTGLVLAGPPHAGSPSPQATPSLSYTPRAARIVAHHQVNMQAVPKATGAQLGQSAEPQTMPLALLGSPQQYAAIKADAATNPHMPRSLTLSRFGGQTIVRRQPVL